MVQCKALTATGKRCRRTAVASSSYCSQHSILHKKTYKEKRRRTRALDRKKMESARTEVVDFKPIYDVMGSMYDQVRYLRWALFHLKHGGKYFGPILALDEAAKALTNGVGINPLAVKALKTGISIDQLQKWARILSGR